mmetsp:Transcript_49513/g.132492  ORF Transcript_49513/g.132492 Transcript_49513/m.132492 type:complete len:208 (-) Transcript_49513:245-868(-)
MAGRRHRSHLARLAGTRLGELRRGAQRPGRWRALGLLGGRQLDFLGRLGKPGAARRGHPLARKSRRGEARARWVARRSAGRRAGGWPTPLRSARGRVPAGRAHASGRQPHGRPHAQPGDAPGAPRAGHRRGDCAAPAEEYRRVPRAPAAAGRLASDARGRPRPLHTLAKGLSGDSSRVGWSPRISCHCTQRWSPRIARRCARRHAGR